ncbi:hypothetical protein IRZ59_20455 [Pseudomonas guariconensis]|uniref:hypothetical protein n=1 Tax=Pseudomonas guariconensis TaxID=1288410 RepID=UPI0018A96764|nr:hypothetical protein [Pseudomonas guariconensis]MBF8732811.1 hypothetical protein [Pseudomonas guariconensis]
MLSKLERAQIHMEQIIGSFLCKASGTWGGGDFPIEICGPEDDLQVVEHIKTAFGAMYPCMEFKLIHDRRISVDGFVG